MHKMKKKYAYTVTHSIPMRWLHDNDHDHTAHTNNYIFKKKSELKQNSNEPFVTDLR